MGRPAPGRPPPLPRSAKSPVGRGPVRRAPRAVTSRALDLGLRAERCPDRAAVVARRGPPAPPSSASPDRPGDAPAHPARRVGRGPLAPRAGPHRERRHCAPRARGRTPGTPHVLLSHGCIPGMRGLRSPALRRAAGRRFGDRVPAMKRSVSVRFLGNRVTTPAPDRPRESTGAPAVPPMGRPVPGCPSVPASFGESRRAPAAGPHAGSPGAGPRAGSGQHRRQRDPPRTRGRTLHAFGIPTCVSTYA
jgi:hypothetical protein